MTNHSIFKEFDNSLKTMVTSVANNNPAPKECRVTGNSFDSVTKLWYADVSVNNAGLKRVKCLGYPRVGAIGILIFIGGNYDSPYLLCNPLDAQDYKEPVKILNLLPNGTFKQYENNRFKYWIGGERTTKDSWYDDSTALIKPKQSLLSNPINIEELYDETEEDLTLIMVYYLWSGGSLELTVIDTDTNEAITLPPENLGNKKEILPFTDEGEWKFNRTFFFIREHKNIQLQFFNSSQQTDILLDGVRVWNEDFDEWHPSKEDI